MSITTKVQKWGNSLAVRLSAAGVAHLKLRAGNAVQILPSKNNHELRIVAVRKEPATLKEILKRITPENKYSEMDWGASTGKETW